MLDLYKNIKIRRRELKISQEGLAKMVGYTDRSMITKVEKGEVDLSQTKIGLFAKALQTTPIDLMGWEEEDKTTDLLIEVTENPDIQLLVEKAISLSDKDLKRLIKYIDFIKEEND